MEVPQITATNSPLADCAHWAVRDLAAKFKQPWVSSSDIVDQIGFAARALRAYQAEVNGRIPADFLPRAMNVGISEPPLDSSIEQLLVSVTMVSSADRDDSCPADDNAVSNKLGEWLASACLRIKNCSAW